MKIIEYLFIISPFAFLAVLIVTFLRKLHIEKRREERRCTCGHETRRIYKMIHFPFGQRETFFCRYYRSYILDVCTLDSCKKIRVVRRGEEMIFNDYKLAWRHLTDPSQFVEDQHLFKDAGIIDSVAPTLAERIAQSERVMKDLEKLMKHREERLIEGFNKHDGQGLPEVPQINPNHKAHLKHAPPIVVLDDLRQPHQINVLKKDRH